MEEEEEEETVISKNSALYSYLLAMETSDDQAAKAEKEILLERIQEDDVNVTAIPKPSNSAFCGKLLSKISRLLSPGHLKSKIFQVWQRLNLILFGSEIILQLLRSDLLDEDDEIMLRAELEILADQGKVGSDARIFSEGIGDVTPTLSRLYYLPLLAVLPYFLIRRSIHHDFVYALDTAMIALTLGSGIRIFRHRCLRNEAALVAALLERSKNVDGLLRKALRTIREYEVLARGYTVVTKYTVVANKAASEPNDVVPCLQLRKCIFIAAESLFVYFRRQTLQLTQRFERFTPLEADTSFLLAETDELQATFGDYASARNWRISLSVLQACCYCLTLQRSEFLRIFALRHGNRHTAFRLLAEAVATISKSQETIRRSLLYYNDGQLVGASVGARKRPPESSAASPMYDYVHSLGLHLRTALERTIEFEHQLTNMVISADDQTTPIGEYHEDLVSTLKKCQACLDEVQVYLDFNRRDKGLGDGSRTELMQPLSVDQGDQNATPRVRLYDGTELEILDQVFEAFTDGEERPESSFSLESHLDGDNVQFTSGRRRVLDELKSVLCVRSSLMHKRELRALATRRGVTVDEILAEEESRRIEEGEKKRKGEEEAESQLTHIRPEYDASVNAAEAGVECRSFASELTMAIQLKGFNRRHQEAVLGDADD